MARVAKASMTKRSATMARKPGRLAKASVAVPPKATPRAAAPSPPPKVSKDELRAQVEKLEQLVASLRAKSRETNKSAKAATARIAELDAQVARLAAKAAAPPPARAKRRVREIDPGEAVQGAEPLDDGSETASAKLDAHLTDE